MRLVIEFWYLEGFWFILEDFFRKIIFLHGEILKFPLSFFYNKILFNVNGKGHGCDTPSLFLGGFGCWDQCWAVLRTRGRCLPVINLGMYSLIHWLSKLSNNQFWYIIVVFNRFVKRVKEPAVLWPQRAETSSSSKIQTTAQHRFGPESWMGINSIWYPPVTWNSPHPLRGPYLAWRTDKEGRLWFFFREQRIYGRLLFLIVFRPESLLRLVCTHLRWASTHLGSRVKNPQNPFKLFLK